MATELGNNCQDAVETGGGVMMRTRPDANLEGYFRAIGIEQVAGVDEVGVGAWAGPVIATAVILLPEHPIEGLSDSKLLSAKRREACSR